MIFFLRNGFWIKLIFDFFCFVNNENGVVENLNGRESNIYWSVRSVWKLESEVGVKRNLKRIFRWIFFLQISEVTKWRINLSIFETKRTGKRRFKVHVGDFLKNFSIFQQQTRGLHRYEFSDPSVPNRVIL